MNKFLFVSLMSIFQMLNSAWALSEVSITVSPSQIIAHRMHSVNHANPLAKSMYMVFVNGLQEGCSSVYLYPDDDPFLYASITSSLASGTNSKYQFYYAIDMDLRGPWGDTKSCMLTSFTQRFD